VADSPADAILGDRSLFPDLRSRAYLSHAAISPVSAPVRAAVLAALSDYASYGMGAFAAYVSQRKRLKTKLETLIGAEPGSIAFVPNTTSGVSSIALCFPYEPGDRIVVFDGEFPANVTPWQRAAELFRLRLVFLPAREYLERQDDALVRLEKVLRAERPRLVCASAVQFQTGYRMPLEAIGTQCRAFGTELFVDGIQACGAVPLDVRAQGIDYMAVGSHKWLMGIEGAGFLYVAPARVSSLRLHVAGWLSHENPAEFLFAGAGHLRYDRPLRTSTDVFEGATQNLLGLVALEAAVDLILKLGVERIWAHANRYLDLLEIGLLQRGFLSHRASEPRARSCILGVVPPGVDSVRLHRQLAQRDIACNVPDGVLRFAPHWPNSLDEVAGVLDAIDELL
jgi:selenocysteine lyase/cysteine desulfurase